MLGGIWEITLSAHSGHSGRSFWPLDIGVCAAGALVLLFGIQLQRIRDITADQITEKDSNTYLTAGRHPVLLPPRLGALLRELAPLPPPAS